jgi:hypothetical protein
VLLLAAVLRRSRFSNHLIKAARDHESAQATFVINQSETNQTTQVHRPVNQHPQPSNINTSPNNKTNRSKRSFTTKLSRSEDEIKPSEDDLSDARIMDGGLWCGTSRCKVGDGTHYIAKLTQA